MRGSLRHQVGAHRFLLRRLDYAILGRSMPLDEDPLRAQRLAVRAGCACAAAVGALAVALAGLHPVVGDAALVMSRQSGELFVRVDDRLRPVANLASAYLILGHPAAPRLVDDPALATIARGPVLGIPGAPRSLGTAAMPADLRWTVCDDRGGTTTVGADDAAEPPEAPAHHAVLVSAADGQLYLLTDGTRAAVDPADPVTARALHLDGLKPRPVSTALLNAIPEVAAIGPPRIPGAGEPSGVAGFPVGSVLRTARAGSEEFYVVLREGTQRVGRLTADLIRFADSGADAEIVSVAPEVVAGKAAADPLAVLTYPGEAPVIDDAPDELCATWRGGRAGIAAGRMPAERPAGVELTTADGDGPNVDRVRMPAGRVIDVAAGMLTTDTGPSGRYLVTDAGVRFAVRDSTAAAALGLTAPPTQIPWAIMATLPAGPELSREASIARDVLATSSP
ncbi:MAG: type VII secretion protein EccB [Mycobacterium sp.]